MKAVNVVKAYFVYEWWNLQFKVDFERQIFRATFHGILILLSEFLAKIC